jgi:hypothetical protein
MRNYVKTTATTDSKNMDWFLPLTEWDPILSGVEQGPDDLSKELMDRYKREEEAFRSPPRRVKRARRAA